MIESKLVQKFGNGGHIVLPKEYVGKRIKFVAEPKNFDDIKPEILQILNPYLDNIIGIYLYGSYSRNEQTISSDVDVLVVTNTKLKIIYKANDYSIISITLKELEETLNKNPILVLPIIKDAKTIINPDLLEKYKEFEFTKNNTKYFIDSSMQILELNKKGAELGFELGSLVYSLILRIRGLLIIKLMIEDKSYSKACLLNFLEKNYLSKDKSAELYEIYSKERSNLKIRESKIINKEDVKKLIVTMEKLLREVASSLK